MQKRDQVTGGDHLKNRGDQGVKIFFQQVEVDSESAIHEGEIQ